MTLILYIAFYHFLLILLLLCCIIIYYYMDQRTTNRERATTGFKSLILLIVICIFLFIIGMIGTWIWTDKPNEFGDSAGVVNALFSALAFAGVIYAIILQKEELEDQRQVMIDQRQEMEQQNSTMIRQRFEMTLFQMLNLQQELIGALKHQYATVVTPNTNVVTPNTNVVTPNTNEERHVDRVITGREVFQYMYIKKKIRLQDNQHDTITYKGMKEVLAKYGQTGYNMSDIPPIFDHYFRHLYRILKYIDGSQDVTGWEAKYGYICIVRGQLSRYELVWLYFNSLFYPKIKRLVEKYALLKNLRNDYLAEGFDLGTEWYQESAFNSDKAREIALQQENSVDN